MASGLTSGLAGGGPGMGNAHATVTMDTSQLSRGVTVAQNVGRQIGRAMGAVEQGVRRAESGFQRFTRGLQAAETQIRNVGLAAGILTGLGLRQAGALQEIEATILAITDSSEETESILASARDRARELANPLGEVLEIYRGLLPLIGGGREELEEWLRISERLRVLNPAADVGIALRNFIGGDPVSLAERFDIPRARIREFTDDLGFTTEALDKLLLSMGITIEDAEKLGKTFNASMRVTRDAINQTLAAAFIPLAEALTPILFSATDFLMLMQDTNPAMLSVAAGVTAATAALSAMLLVVNQLVRAWQALNITAGIKGAAGLLARAGPAAGLAGLAGVGGAIGLGLGIGGTRAVGQVTGDEQLKQFGLQDFLRGFIRMIREGLVQELQRAGAAVGLFSRAMVAAQRIFTASITGMVNAVGRFISFVGRIIPGSVGEGLQAAGGRVTEGAEDFRGTQEARAAAFTEAVDRGLSRIVADLTMGIFSGRVGAEDAAAAKAAAEEKKAIEEQLNEDLAAAAVERARALEEVERSSAQARLEAVKNFEQQRAETIRNFQKSSRRQQEDFALSQQRAAEGLQRSIDDIYEGQARREADAVAKMNERVSEVREDGNEQIADLEEKYARDRAEAARQHQETILQAASSLDASAILEEQRRFGLEETRAESEFNRQRAEIREQVDERIAQEREGHEERLRAGREADERRVADLRENYELQRQQTREDRRIQLERQRQDHNEQLIEQERQHGERLEQIDQQAGDERERINQAYVDQLIDLGKFYDGQEEIIEDFQEDAIEKAKAYWKALEDMVPTPPRATGQSDNPHTPQTVEGFQHGGLMQRDGLAMLHAGEAVLSPRVTQELAAMLGASGSGGALAAGGRSMTVNIGDGAFPIFAGPDAGADVQRQVRDALADFFQEMAEE